MNNKKPTSKCSFRNCRRRPEFVSQEPLSPQTCTFHIKAALKKWTVTALIPIAVWNLEVCPDRVHPIHVGCRKTGYQPPTPLFATSMATMAPDIYMTKLEQMDANAQRLRERVAEQRRREYEFRNEWARSYLDKEI